jgi:hypothetical protein
MPVQVSNLNETRRSTRAKDLMLVTVAVWELCQG